MNETIKRDLEEFLRAHDKFSTTVLRMLKSAIQNETINKRSELTDDEIISVIKKQVKVKKDSIEEYTKYNKLDTVEELKREINILSKYLPEEMSDEELTKVIDDIISSIDSPSIKDMGTIMKKVSEKVGNTADMGKVSTIVKLKLK